MTWWEVVFVFNALSFASAVCWVLDELNTWLVAQLRVPVDVAEVVVPSCCPSHFLCCDTLLQARHCTEEEIFSGKGNAKLFPALWGAVRPLTMASVCETSSGSRCNSPPEDVEKNGWERGNGGGGRKNNIAGKHNGEQAVVWVCRSPRQWEAWCGCCIRCRPAGSRCLRGWTQWVWGPSPSQSSLSIVNDCSTGGKRIFLHRCLVFVTDSLLVAFGLFSLVVSQDGLFFSQKIVSEAKRTKNETYTVVS